MKTFWKGLIMALVGFIATTLSDLETFNLAYVVITSVAFTLIYLGKNALLPSGSLFGRLDVQDLLSGLLLAVGMAISSFAGSIITTGMLDWHGLWIAIVGAVVGYFGKTLAQKGKK